MRLQDDRSQQSNLGLCDQDSGIRQSRRKIPHSDCSLQKTFNSCLSETLAKPHQAGEAYRRRAKVVAPATSCSADSGGPWDRRMRRAYRYLGHDSRTPEICVAALRSRLSNTPRQQKFNEMNGGHLASPIRGELGYAHWPQLGTQVIALLGTIFGVH